MIKLTKKGLQKKVSTGYSWKSLFFGVFYAVWRGDIKGIIIQTLLVVVTGFACWIFIPFRYNKIYIRRLIEKGWKPFDENALKYLQKKYNYKLNK